MKNTKVNAARVWKQFEDVLAPRLNFSRMDRVIYSHLFRHSRLEGKLEFRFSIAWLARGVGFSMKATRDTVRSLIARGVLDLVERNCFSRHVVRVRLPWEVEAVESTKTKVFRAAKSIGLDIEEADFLEKEILRESIHDREGGRCFYCMRRITRNQWCLDHVVPQARAGGNTYRNLVSCCAECNSAKQARSAEEFLRWLYRERKLSADELGARLRAVQMLAAGKLIPQIDSSRAVNK